MAFKTCTFCQEPNGVRSLKCKSCGQPFPRRLHKIEDVGPSKYLAPLSEGVKKRTARFKTISWRDLLPGDKIKVSGRSGPYYMGDDGERHYTTTGGYYIVVSLDNMGINCRGMGKICGHQFIYMGPHIKSPLSNNLYRDKHKFRKVRVKQ